MEPKRSTRSTKLSRWADSATDAQWDALIQDLDNYAGQKDGDQQFTDKYGFSMSGIKPYLEIHKAEIRIRAEYEEKFQAELSKRGEVTTQLTYKKPATPYKKVTLTLTEEAYNTLIKTANKLSEEYGYEKRYCASVIVLDACKRFE